MAARTNMDQHPKSKVYRYRKGIPEHLRPFMPEPFTGKREMVRSLGTKNLSDAKRLHTEVAPHMERFLDHAKREYEKANPPTGTINISMRGIPLSVPMDDFQINIAHDGLGFGCIVEAGETITITPPTIKPQPASAGSNSINAVYDAYCRSVDAAPNTIVKFRKSWELFCEFSGITMDHSIKVPTLDMIREFKRAIVDCPAKRTKAMNEMGIHKLLEYARSEYANPNRTTKFEPIDIKSLKQHLAALSAVLKFAVREGDRIDDPTSSGICQVKITSDEKRPAYNKADLIGIFNHPIFREPTWDHRQWMPVVALYTGCRAGEIGNLLIEDIKQDGAVWFFSIRKTNDAGVVVKRVKSRASTRPIPIHKELIALGFLKHVQAMKDAGETRVFPTYTSQQYHSTWWGEQRAAMGITDERKVFHSFRHSLRDACRRAKMPSEISKAIMGHSGKDIHDTYGDGHGLDELREWVDTVDYGITIPKPTNH